MIYDTHSHPYLAKEKSQEVILENFFKNTKNRLNSIACDLESSNTCIKLAQAYPWVHATIGIHPTHCLDYIAKIEDSLLKLEKLFLENSRNIVAIWEIWLDYHWIDSLSQKYNISQEEVKQIQKDFLKKQIQLAKKLHLPIVIHNRDSSEDILEILIQEGYGNFVFHCYSEDLGFAKKLLYNFPDCKLWFWWIVTFKSTQKIQEVAATIPLKNIIIETDSPYLTPTPYRGKEENEPVFCENVLSKIIDLREESPEKIRETIYQNSLDFFWVL